MLRGSQVDVAIVILSALWLAASVLAGCTRAPSPDTPVTPPAQPSAMPPVDLELPAPLYFLRDGQIWRLATDRDLVEQITDEARSITDIDVSPADGALAYLTDNHLIHADGDGANRRVLVVGPRLPPVADELASLNDRDHIAGKIVTPRWSPNGDRIAYVQNGLRVISAAGGEPGTVRPNDMLPEPGVETYDGSLVFMSVIGWSPDGDHLLAEVYRYPLSSVYNRSVGIAHLTDGSMELAYGALCHFAWSPDSQHFYVANPAEGDANSLARYDMATGRQALIGLYVPARTVYFYAHPHALNPDEMLIFMALGSSPDELPGPFKMHRVQKDGYGTTLLREEGWSLETALWARDGSAALIVTASPSAPVEGAEEIPADTLVWLPVGPGPVVTLPVTGARTLRWGLPQSR